MLTMLIGGSRDGWITDVREDTPYVVSPVPTEPKLGPFESYSKFDYETYDRKSIWFGDASRQRPEFNWHQIVYVHSYIDFESFTESEFVSIVMRLWRERWRRKVSAQTPEYVKRAWREKGVTAYDQRV